MRQAALSGCVDPSLLIVYGSSSPKRKLKRFKWGTPSCPHPMKAASEHAPYSSGESVTSS